MFGLSWFTRFTPMLFIVLSLKTILFLDYLCNWTLNLCSKFLWLVEFTISCVYMLFKSIWVKLEVAGEGWSHGASQGTPAVSTGRRERQWYQACAYWLFQHLINSEHRHCQGLSVSWCYSIPDSALLVNIKEWFQIKGKKSFMIPCYRPVEGYGRHARSHKYIQPRVPLP